jgi:hypothetical protein
MAHSIPYVPPVCDTALANALIARFVGNGYLPQRENIAFLAAVQDLATAHAVVRAHDAPSTALVAAWSLGVAEFDPETAERIWTEFLCPHYSHSERMAFRTEQARLRRLMPPGESLEVRRNRVKQLRVQLSLDASHATRQSWDGAPYEVWRVLHQLGHVLEERWKERPAARSAPAKRLSKHQEKETLLDSLKRFVEQTERLRQRHHDVVWSEAEWAWKVWKYLDSDERFDAWLRQRLMLAADRDDSTSAPRDGPLQRQVDAPAAEARDLRAGLIRFFDLATVLAAYERSQVLEDDQVYRVARVEVLLGGLRSTSFALLPPAAYALPLVRRIGSVLRQLSGVNSACARRAICVLELLLTHLEHYDVAAEPMRLPRLSHFPTDAAAHWDRLLRTLGAGGVRLLQQRTVRLQLVRALHVAAAPHADPLARWLCAHPALLRQWSVERVGLGQRCRGDSRTEFGVMQLKLRRRARTLASALLTAHLPGEPRETVRRVAGAIEELSALCAGENSAILPFAVADLYDNTIRPMHAHLDESLRRLVAGVGILGPCDPLHQLRDAAQRVVWTAEDLTDGFFRAKRNVGLRRLIGLRDGERWDDLFSPA